MARPWGRVGHVTFDLPTVGTGSANGSGVIVAMMMFVVGDDGDRRVNEMEDIHCYADVGVMVLQVAKTT